jgi:hypothetical protein
MRRRMREELYIGAHPFADPGMGLDRDREPSGA